MTSGRAPGLMRREILSPFRGGGHILAARLLDMEQKGIERGQLGKFVDELEEFPHILAVPVKIDLIKQLVKGRKPLLVM